MFRRSLLLAFAMLGYAAGALSTEASAKRFLQSQAWAGANTPRQVNVIFGGTMGDLNGDALPDYAAVVSVGLDQGLEEERLVVLAGTADGTYKLLSQSGAFCGVGRSGKFYDFRIDANSLFVQAVWTAEPERHSALTMQFRFNRDINDLQLIGEEEVSIDEGQEYKVSINYLTGTAIYTRQKGKRRKQFKASLTEIRLLRLQAFECFSQDALKPLVYIDQNFKLKSK